ncbi:MAG: hypothetical protein OXG18_10890 [Gemmatimonadetes bacterium]|nr:hypothetical protein [Gemmatimonadota bacterium]
MRKGVGFGLLVVLAMAAALACEDFDPLELHPDVVSLEVLLVAGESEARMLASHPHQEGAIPEVSAHLEGPGWEAEFSETLELEACTVAEDVESAKCLGAVLPEPLRAGTTYALRGTAPLGSFTGETRVPGGPRLSVDTLRLSWPDGGEPRLPIPFRHQAGSDIGVLAVDVRDIFETRERRTEVELPPYTLRLLPRAIDPAATADTVWIDVLGNPLRFSLTLLGIGWHWTNFANVVTPAIRPWPAFGIEGDGVYGYFDGVTRSPPLRVLVR